jgi:hypothetical protein
MRAKLTIELSGRALDTLERLMKSSGFGSRGRTIEEAILATDELSRLADLLSNLLPNTAGTMTPEQSTRLIMAIQTFMTYYVATISRFRKPDWVNPPPPTEKRPALQ